MTVRTPRWLQGGSHAAEDDRLFTAALVNDAGVNHPDHLTVAQQGTPAMSVQVAAGSAFVAGTESAQQGVYFAYNDATVNVAISAADATNPRRDLIVCRVKDAAYSGASNEASIESVTGTPAASPSLPTVPANCHVLAEIAVAAGATSITNAHITDRREYSSLFRAPRGELAYAALASTTADITAETDIIAAAAVTVEADRKVRLDANLLYRYLAAETSMVWMRIKEGGTSLVDSRAYKVMISQDRLPLAAMIRITPTAGTHTYKITGEVTGGAGAFRVEAPPSGFATLSVTDVGGLDLPAGSSGQP